jgi:hypothetical protein
MWNGSIIGIVLECSDAAVRQDCPLGSWGVIVVILVGRCNAAVSRL